MDRCALFVDAAYLLAEGAMAVHGTRQRDAVTWDYSSLLGLLNTLAVKHTQQPLLRCYWYEITAEAEGTPEHDKLAEIAGLKLRLQRARSRQGDGIGLMAYRDLSTLAREHAVCDAVVVSGDEDMVHAVADAQDRGVRVTGVHIPVDGDWTIAPPLRWECDEFIEVAAAQLRPYVGLRREGGVSSSQFNGQAPTGSVPTRVQAPPARHRAGDPSSDYSGPRSAPPSRTEETPWHGGFADAMPDHRAGADPSAQVDHGRQHQQAQQDSHGPYDRDRQQQWDEGTPQQAPSELALPDAVRDAHQEGRDFGDSVARDAPALWLEAVLARRPRMPSDLEARLLQGSALPMDFLLHDEVRHALRRGFWEALERPER